MMNYIWAGMLVLGVVFAVINGRLNEFSEGLMKSCTEGVYFIIGLAGIMGVWSGIMNIAKETGLIDMGSQCDKTSDSFSVPTGPEKGYHCNDPDELYRESFRSREQRDGVFYQSDGDAG